MSRLKGKVITGFILTCLAIVFSILITRYTFTELLGTVNSFAEPNEKLQKLHSFYHQVTQLEQKQREESIQSPRKPFSSYINETDTLHSILYDLKNMEWNDDSQIVRLDSMERILRKRNSLFISYLKL